MADLNSFSCTGRLVEDCKVKDVQGKVVAQYKIAVNPVKRDVDALWVTCDHWNAGGVVDYLKKGTQVAVTGPLKMAKWKGKDGAERQALQLDVRSLVLVGSKPKAEEEPAPVKAIPAKAKPKQPAWEEAEADAADLPF